VALGKIGDPRATKHLVSALTQEHGKAGFDIAVALEAVGWRPGRDALGATYWVARREVFKCVEIGIPAVEPLLAAYEDHAIERQGVAEALGKIGDPRAVEPLLAALNGDCPGYVRHAILESLGMLGDRRVVPTLIANLNSSPETRTIALNALDRLGWHPDGSEDGAAYWLARGEWDKCVQVGGPAVTPLIGALYGRGEDMTVGAVLALVEIGAAAVEPLISIVSVQHSMRWAAAAEALGLIGEPRAVEPLLPALKDTNTTEFEAAAVALGRIGDARAVGPLLDALDPKYYRDDPQELWPPVIEALAAFSRAGKLNAMQKVRLIAAKRAVGLMQ
jgi:HEAT repeat protein